MTIPRLQLCGALIVARLLKHVSSILHIPAENTFAWTDSCVVSGWLRVDPRRFKAFVRNRVSEVLELASPNSWRHVTGKDNPADCALRGLYSAQLADHQRWWQGPEWLRQPESQWPNAEHSLIYDASNERAINLSRVALHARFEDHALPLLTCISNYSRLVRATAWILRFVYNLRHPERKQGALSAKQLKGAEMHWLKEVQHSAYGSELQILHDNKPLARTSRLINFRPFNNDDGLLCVGGPSTIT